MRIPRKKILEQKELLRQVNEFKMIHYRELILDINRSNFHLCTKVDFKAIEKKSEHKDIHETWGRLKSDTPHTYFHKTNKKGSKSKSQYIIDDDDNVYRFSDHWGAVATCEWTREGEGQLMMSVFETGDWEIGVAKLSDFKVFRRKDDRRKDYLINPEWIEQMEQFISTSKLLTEMKNSEEFKTMSNDRKKFIGENFGFFKKNIQEFYKQKHKYNERNG